jgi:hypothetical protein
MLLAQLKLELDHLDLRIDEADALIKKRSSSSSPDNHFQQLYRAHSGLPTTRPDLPRANGTSTCSAFRRPYPAGNALITVIARCRRQRLCLSASRKIIKNHES